MKRIGWIFFTVCLWAAASVFAGERIVVIGDSITGHSMNLPYGFTHEFRAALAASGHSDVEFIPLGGSGQSIVTWQDILKNSYQNDQKLDIPDIFVKTELDKGADTVLVHLGMNDALKPSFVADQGGYAVWKSEYVKFIGMIKERIPSKRLIITTPTMLTESPWAFKNEAMDRLSLLAHEAADETGVEFFDLRAEFKKYFENARMLDPATRFTLDFVHPNQLGHQVMTAAMLDVLGYADAAEKYRAEKMTPSLLDFDSPGMALFVVHNDNAKQVIVKGRLRGAAKETLVAAPPEGLTVEGIDAGDGDAFTIRLSGDSPALSADLTVTAGDLSRTVKINAPYYVTAGIPMAPYAKPEDFPRDKSVTQIDRDILAGKNPLETQIDGRPVVWTVCRPTADETGAENPNAIDLANLSPASAFDAAYVVRQVFSPKAQSVALKLNSEGFSTTAINTIYLNGQEIYFGCLSPRHIKAKDELSVELKEGLNVLAARVDHTNWQWAMSFALEGEGLTY